MKIKKKINRPKLRVFILYPTSRGSCDKVNPTRPITVTVRSDKASLSIAR